MKPNLIYFDGIRTYRLKKLINLRKKWTSICLSVDYIKDEWKLFVNGKDDLPKPWEFDGRKIMKFIGCLKNAS